MNDWVIKTEGLGKQYARPSWPFGRRSVDPSLPWALRDLTTEIGPGETVGIIGRNGSGKSTLLKLLSGVMRPSAGAAQVRGRLDAMLELGTAFDADLSGRANIDLYVALLGLSGARARRQSEEIVAFAEMADHIDRPMSTYSTGMFIRLAFAAQTSLAPQILIVDEALSVGDHFFQQKAAARIEGLVNQGTTLLFVSHDAGLMRRLCHRVLYLRQGCLIVDGEPSLAIRAYMQESPDGTAGHGLPDFADAGQNSTRAERHSPVFEQALWARKAEARPGEIVAVAATSPAGLPITSVRMGGTIVLHVLFVMPDIPDVQVVLRIQDRLGQWVTSTGSAFTGLGPSTAPAGATVHFVAEVEAALEAGSYDVGVSIGTMMGNRVDRILDAVTQVGPLDVTFDYRNDPAPFLGRFGLNVKTHYLDPRLAVADPAGQNRERADGLHQPGSRGALLP